MRRGGGVLPRNTQIASQSADSHTLTQIEHLASTGRPGRRWVSAKWLEKQRRRGPEPSGGGKQRYWTTTEIVEEEDEVTRCGVEAQR